MKDVSRIYNESCEEFIIFMQKFEVVLQLDDQRLLIPSLLPDEEEESCVIFGLSISARFNETAVTNRVPMDVPHVLMCNTPHHIFCRYYLLPFIPNGFFSRVMARLMSSGMISLLNKSLIDNKLGDDHIINAAHWKCWRNGILIIWRHFEIFRIAPLSSNLPGMETVGVIAKRNSCELLNELKGIAIKVTVLPEEYIRTCSTIMDSQLSTGCKDSEKEYFYGKCLSTWMLHQATTIIDSVFEDWYESFAKNKGFNLQDESVRIANPCQQCIMRVQKEQVRYSTPELVSFPPSAAKGGKDSVCYMFTSPYVAFVSAGDESLVCPDHGTQSVTDIAPDLVSSHTETKYDVI